MSDAGESAETARPPGSALAEAALLDCGFHRHLDGFGTTYALSPSSTAELMDRCAVFRLNHNKGLLAIAAGCDAVLVSELQRMQVKLAAQPQDMTTLALQAVLLDKLASCFVLLFCLACNSRYACGGSRYRCGTFPTRS